MALGARDEGAGRDRIIIPVPDGAGWHTAPHKGPEGLHLARLPPSFPERQPVETPWIHVDEPIANRRCDTLDDLDPTLPKRCVTLANNRDLIPRRIAFHRWPKPHLPI